MVTCATSTERLSRMSGSRDVHVSKASTGFLGQPDRVFADSELTRANGLALDVFVSADRRGGTDSRELAGDRLRHATAHAAHGACQLRAR